MIDVCTNKILARFDENKVRVAVLRQNGQGEKYASWDTVQLCTELELISHIFVRSSMYPSHTLCPHLFSRYLTTIIMALDIMATFLLFFTSSLTEPSLIVFRTSNLFMCNLFYWCQYRTYVYLPTVAACGTFSFSDAVKM